MLKKQTEQQSELEFVSIEELVPADHLLRKIAEAVDFGFIYDKVEGLYCLDNGRPSVDRMAHGKRPLEPVERKDALKKTDFVYDEHYDCYLCPQGQVLKYATTNREGYREYKSKPEQCRECPLLKHCTVWGIMGNYKDRLRIDAPHAIPIPVKIHTRVGNS